VLLGFKQRFATYVEEGSKRHTIRAPRKGRDVAIGDRLDCYANPRQKSMRLLGRFSCIAIDEVLLKNDGRSRDGWLLSLRIYVNGVLLRYDEAALLAWRDGFRPYNSTELEPGDSLKLMAQFWDSRLNPDGEWTGRLIHWKYPGQRLLKTPARRNPSSARNGKN